MPVSVIRWAVLPQSLPNPHNGGIYPLVRTTALIHRRIELLYRKCDKEVKTRNFLLFLVFLLGNERLIWRNGRRLAASTWRRRRNGELWKTWCHQTGVKCMQLSCAVFNRYCTISTHATNTANIPPPPTLNSIQFNSIQFNWPTVAKVLFNQINGNNVTYWNKP